LRADHEEFHAQWQRLRPLLSQVMLGRDAPLTQLQTLAPRFAELHERHLELESSLAFPQAHQLMRHSEDPLMEVRMGEEMASRRGVGGAVVRD
jgi:hemerythrin-like domain-containing protein